MLRVVTHSLGPLPPIPLRPGSWRAELDAALVPGSATAVALERLHQPGALVVTTGQQPGLFTGPLYTVHKALSAAALARVLERRWRRPVVPVFWIAGDDHDFAEASAATWLDSTGTLIDWRLPARPASAPQLSMSEEKLPAAITDGLARLEHDLPAGASRDATLASLRHHYLPGATLHAAFSGALAELLAPFGVVCFDPASPAAKRAQVPVIKAALDRASEFDRALAALPPAGSGIAAGEGASLVFLSTPAGRERLLIDGDGFKTRRSRTRHARAELDQLLAQEPARFSANVLLRPVVESALLPTVAYAAGPGELQYLTGQAAALYPLLGVHQQQPVPRWSGTVVEHWAERLLQRLGLDSSAVLDDDGHVARSMLERDFPDDARAAVDALRSQIRASGDALTDAGSRIDPVLRRAVIGRARRLDELSVDLEKVLLRHLRKRNDIAFAQYQRLVTALRPRGAPQERILSAPSFLGRHGQSWLAAIAECTAAWAEGLPESPR